LRKCIKSNKCSVTSYLSLDNVFYDWDFDLECYNNHLLKTFVEQITIKGGLFLLAGNHELEKKLQLDKIGLGELFQVIKATNNNSYYIEFIWRDWNVDEDALEEKN